MRSDYNFINGTFLETDAQRIAVHNPATGELIGHVSAASAADATRAVEAAATAQRSWRRLPAAERGAILARFADAIDARSPVIGAVLAAESGKSVADATSEAHYAAEILRYHAQWARRIEGEVIPSDSANENLILMREPIGVAACLIPFNFPIYSRVPATTRLARRSKWRAPPRTRNCRRASSTCWRWITTRRRRFARIAAWG
jgi:lactaldehyde dehydrogenase/glycolaldehyde dehydrogenase